MTEKIILLVEDDYLNRRLSKKILLESGFQVLEAKNTLEARAILKTKPVDIAILDINLGDENYGGISIGQHIKDHYGIPFIFLTAYENPEVIGKAVATIPCSYLTKPYKNADLIASVKIAVSQCTDSLQQVPKIVVKQEDYNVELPIDTIYYIESEGNYLLFYTDLKIYKSRSTIKQILETLPPNLFIQTHRAFVVNKTKIEKFNLQSLVVNGTTIPVTKTFVDCISKFNL